MILARTLAAFAGGALVVVWILYPLTIAFLAAVAKRVRQRGRESEAATPQGARSVSIIVAAREDAAAIGQRIADCVRAAEGLTTFEIIVGLDARGALATAESLATDANVRVVHGDPPGGKAATLNAAARAATGDLLVFTDVNQRFEPEAIPRLQAVFADERVGAASGRLELAASARQSLAGRYWSYERWLRRREAELHSCVGVTGAIWAMRRSLWSALPAGLILDDVYAPMRIVLAGHRVAFVDEARARDLRPASRGHEYRRKVRTLTGVVQLCAWLPQVLNPFRNSIWLQFVFHKLLRLLTPYLLLAVGVWAGLAGVRWLVAKPALLAAGAIAVLLAAVALRSRAKVLARLRGAALSALVLQLAVVVATINGVRRRWDVWRA